MTGDELDLRDLIYTASLELGVPDWEKVTDNLLRELTAAQQRQALRVTLPNYVRLILSHRWPVPEEETAAPGKGRSRLRAAGAYYAELQRSCLTESGWKRYRDLTAKDCDFLAAHRDRQAADIAAQAEQFRRAGTQLRRLDKPVIGKLPVSALDAVFRVDAA